MLTIKNKTFRTKTGFCHVLPDKILFSKNEDLEKAQLVVVCEMFWW